MTGYFDGTNLSRAILWADNFDGSSFISETFCMDWWMNAQPLVAYHFMHFVFNTLDKA